MANKLYTQYKYRFEMIYVDNVKNTSTKIKTECMRSIIIDHNYEENCMPIIYTTMRLDKALTDIQNNAINTPSNKVKPI